MKMKIRKNFIIIFVFILTLLFSSACFAEFREIKFGSYRQNANSKELSPIEWLVLDENYENGENNNGMLLITKKCIDEVPYNERRANVTWETCTLRKWLNSEFLNAAFTPEEQNLIIPAVMSDKIFILDRDEVIKYMPNETDRQCVPTDYAYHRGIYINGNGLCAWWTRSAEKSGKSGKSGSQASYLSSYGSFGNRPHYVDDDIIGVRPVIWLKNNKKNKNLSVQEAEKILHSVKPDAQKAYEIETKLQPMLEQDAPFDVKELYDYFLENPEEALKKFDRKRIEVQGIVLQKGPDRMFGQPSIELSDSLLGKCYVLCVFQDAKSYDAVKTGDKITARGNYLVVNEGYGIVLKICEII